MSSTDENIIYLNNSPTIASEPTLSMDSGPVISFNHNGSLSPVDDDEEGNYLPSDSPTNTTVATSSSRHWIKRNYLPLTLAFLLLSGVVFAAAVFRPGGPGNPNKVQTNQVDAILRGTDITTDGDGDGMVLIARPTYWPTYTPTVSNGGGGAAEETEIEVPDTVVPTPTPTVTILTSFPTPATVSTKPTFSPAFWNLFDPTSVPTVAPVVTTTSVPTDVPTVAPVVTTTSVPTDVPTAAPVTDVPTMVPTVYVTGQVSETVSTEVTGPPTAADREP